MQQQRSLLAPGSTLRPRDSGAREQAVSAAAAAAGVQRGEKLSCALLHQLCYNRCTASHAEQLSCAPPPPPRRVRWLASGAGRGGSRRLTPPLAAQPEVQLVRRVSGEVRCTLYYRLVP
jgi:hypothetical protein